MMDKFDILYQDAHLIAIHKPAGIHVHPTGLSKGEDSCMRILRDQIGRWVYTVHRLDRATSGALLFALDSDTARRTIELFTERRIQKRYWAVVRGYVKSAASIDHPLREEPHKSPAEAVTAYKRLAKTELPVAVGKFPTARYSLVEVSPKTGRKNQIRKHFVHISHPIVGDVRLGDGKHNRLFREHFNCHRLLLMAMSLALAHPVTGEPLTIQAPLPDDVQHLFRQLDWRPEIRF